MEVDQPHFFFSLATLDSPNMLIKRDASLLAK